MKGHQFEKQQRFSIRKFSVGVCSALIGLAFLGTGVVSADETYATNEQPLEASTANTEDVNHLIKQARDYKADTIQDMQTGEVSSTGLPTSNVLYYDLSDDAWLCVRPSGTEPKVKFYYGIKGTSLSDADEKSAAMGKEVLAMIDKIM